MAVGWTPSFVAWTGAAVVDARLGTLCAGVALGALIAVPAAFFGSVFGARIGNGRERWSHTLFSVVGRMPTLLTAALFGSIWSAMGHEATVTIWGMVAMLAGLPVIWRIVARALSELPPGVLEAASCLGLSRTRGLWLVGTPVIGLTLAGALLVGLSRALIVAWFLTVVTVEQSSWLPLPWGLILLVVLTTLGGTLLLAVARRCLRSLKKGAL